MLSQEKARLTGIAEVCAIKDGLSALRWKDEDGPPGYEPYRNCLPVYKEKSSGPYPGLQNIGRTCFLNAIFQCLVHLGPLRMRLVQASVASCTDLGKSVKKFFKEYEEHKWVTMSPIEAVRDFFLSSEAVAKGIRAGVQQDAVLVTW